MERTAQKVEDVEGIVVQTQMKVEKTEFDNLKNEKRIENAEKRINDVEAVGLRALHTENRVLDAQVRPIGQGTTHLDGAKYDQVKNSQR